MSRPRLFVPGLSHHVRHRGNNRSDVFRDDHDRHTFLSLLRTSALDRQVAIHGYVLMTTHFHLILTAPDENALPRLMQSFGCRYVRYFNERHHRTGTLWEGRYWANVIADERYWLTCLRYIEMNPLAARLVTSPQAYPWSSYHANAMGRADALLTPHPLYLQLGSDVHTRAARWSEMCGQPVAEADRAQIRAAIRLGRPLGADATEELSAGIVLTDPCSAEAV